MKFSVLLNAVYALNTIKVSKMPQISLSSCKLAQSQTLALVVCPTEQYLISKPTLEFIQKFEFADLMHI
jgi:hypothetical protein